MEVSFPRGESSVGSVPRSIVFGYTRARGEYCSGWGGTAGRWDGVSRVL